MLAAGCSDAPEQPSPVCKKALTVADELLKAAAEGMVANQDLLDALVDGDAIKGSSAIETIRKSNDTVDRVGEVYIKSRDECLGN